MLRSHCVARLLAFGLLVAAVPAQAGFKCPAKGGSEWREYRSAHFHRRVGFLAGTHAIQEVLNVGFDRDRRLHLLDGFRVLKPWLFPDAEPGGVEDHGSLVALELHGPIVVV